MAQIVVEMSSDEAKLYRGFQKIVDQQGKLQQGLKKTGQASEDTGRKMKQTAGQAGRAFGGIKSQLTQIAGLVGVGGGLVGGIAAINRGYGVWLQNIREISREAKKATGEIIAFAALQEGGTKAARVTAAAKLAVKYGISDRGEAFNTVQALQSALGGDIRKGMTAAETVFAASQVGIPVEAGRELEVLGASQGQQVGQALRRAYVAGQASSRDPALLAQAAPGLKFFQDKDFGFAVAGVLAGTLKEGQIDTYVKQAGMALSKIGPGQEAFKELGLAEASQSERLRALAERGISTPEALAKFGFTEKRQIEALAGLVPNIADVVRIQKEIRTKAKRGLFRRHRAGIEAELPATKIAREIDVVKSAYQHEKAFGPAALGALRETREQRARALAFKRMGYEQSLWFDLIEEGEEGVGEASRVELGQALLSGINILDVEAEKRRILKAQREGIPIAETPWTWKFEAKHRARREARARLQPPPPETAEQIRAWRIAQGAEEAGELSGAAQEISAAAGELSASAKELRGGATLRRPNDDL